MPNYIQSPTIILAGAGHIIKRMKEQSTQLDCEKNEGKTKPSLCIPYFNDILIL